MKLSAATILLVDDEPILRMAFAAWLTLSGVGRVLTAEHGEAALPLLAAEPVHALITDVCMPVLDGPGLIYHLARHHRRLPILLLAGGFPNLDESELAALGVVAFFPKPLDRARLLRTLEQAVAPQFLTP